MKNKFALNCDANFFYFFIICLALIVTYITNKIKNKTNKCKNIELLK